MGEITDIKTDGQPTKEYKEIDIKKIIDEISTQKMPYSTDIKKEFENLENEKITLKNEIQELQQKISTNKNEYNSVMEKEFQEVKEKFLKETKNNVEFTTKLKLEEKENKELE